jgi:hypothetical protein
MKNTAASHLVTAAVASGVLMAAYLLLRPYGDVQGRKAEVDAMASTLWVVSHSLGMLALACFASLVLRLSDLSEGWIGVVGQWSAITGLVLVLPYYGAEAFALPVIAEHSARDPGSVDMVEQIRNQPVAITAFGIGLLLLAVSGICLAIMWRSVASGRAGWAAAPLGGLMALLLPQFFLPPAGRMAYGVLFLAAAVGFALTVSSVSSRHRTEPAAVRADGTEAASVVGADPSSPTPWEG